MKFITTFDTKKLILITKIVHSSHCSFKDWFWMLCRRYSLFEFNDSYWVNTSVTSGLWINGLSFEMFHEHGHFLTRETRDEMSHSSYSTYYEFIHWELFSFLFLFFVEEWEHIQNSAVVTQK